MQCEPFRSLIIILHGGFSMRDRVSGWRAMYKYRGHRLLVSQPPGQQEREIVTYAITSLQGMS